MACFREGILENSLAEVSLSVLKAIIRPFLNPPLFVLTFSSFPASPYLPPLTSFSIFYLVVWA